MNTKTILNITAFALVVIGILLKALYIAGGPIAIILSGVIMLLTLFLFAAKDNKEAGLTDGMNYFLIGTLAFLIIGVIFKIQHWPGAGLFINPAYALIFILPVILFLQKGDFKISKQFFITFSIYFILVVSVFIRQNPISNYVGRGWDFPMTGEETTADSTKTATETDK